jgi:serine/threonine-protein kinase
VSQFSSIEHLLPAGLTIRGQLAAGGTSWIYLAEREGDGAQLVIKVMHPGMAQRDQVERFRREMEVLRRLEHPRIVPLLESGEREGLLFFTMPYVPGDTLRERLRRAGPMEVREALQVTCDLVGALGHAHTRGVVHRDVKPENIVLGPDGAALLDFGFAHAPSLTDHEVAAREAELVLGTPGYMSPEQLSGKRAEDWRTDFFSLGCVLYEMLAGKPPYGIDNSQLEMQRRHAGAIPDIREVRPDVPDDVAAIVRRNLAASPNDRYATAVFLRMAIEGAMARLDDAAGDATVGAEARGGATTSGPR